MNYYYSTKHSEREGGRACAAFLNLWAINVRVSLLWELFFSSASSSSVYYCICGRVDKLFFVANVQNAWAPKKNVGGLQCKVHSFHRYFLWQWAKAKKKLLENNVKIVKWLHFGNGEFNQFNCIHNALNAIQRRQMYSVCWFWFGLDSNSMYVLHSFNKRNIL